MENDQELLKQELVLWDKKYQALGTMLANVLRFAQHMAQHVPCDCVEKALGGAVPAEQANKEMPAGMREAMNKAQNAMNNLKPGETVTLDLQMPAGTEPAKKKK